MRSTRQGSNPAAVPQANRVSRAIQALRPRRSKNGRSTQSDQTACSSPAPSKPPLGRRVTLIVSSCAQVNSHGLGVCRPSEPLSPAAFSPFLLLDHCTPQRLAPTCHRSADAPRRGLQTLTYLTQGSLTYSDSHGHSAKLHPGHTALLSANSGLVVSNRFSGPVVEYFSVWINTTSDFRNENPQYHRTNSVPAAYIGQGHASARIKVLTAPVKKNNSTTHSSTPELASLAGNAAVYDIRMRPLSQLVLNPETTRVFVYVYRGAAIIGKSTEVREGQMAVLEEDQRLPLVIKSIGNTIQSNIELNTDVNDFETFEPNSCWCLVLAGDPIEEPVSMLPSGIVACTPQEMRKAFEQYTCGDMAAASPPSINSSPFALFEDDNSDDESFDEMKKMFDGLTKKKSDESLPDELMHNLKT